jgi:hypothetical protein
MDARPPLIWSIDLASTYCDVSLFSLTHTSSKSRNPQVIGMIARVIQLPCLSTRAFDRRSSLNDWTRLYNAYLCEELHSYNQ